MNGFSVGFRQPGLALLMMSLAAIVLIGCAAAPAAQPAAPESQPTAAAPAPTQAPTTAPAASATLAPTAPPAATLPATMAPTVAAATATQPAAAPTAAATATQPAKPATVSYAKDVAPIFEQRCVKCHGGDRVEEGFDMKTYAAVMKGSNNGPVVKPSNAKDSELVILIVDGKMPKRAARLPDAEIAKISDWVNAGAPNN
ncbi:MAG: hypothetical protein FJ011_00520 [Chloroflexi bacterium]|nr:hypothetical protein [Chloroflexota bacterium]